ncbi:MAG: polyprenyl synthetase family protein [Lactobacillales bacterium]|nr:polyprenyl synthetase family protein [Lactobacillales bacterium]
MEEFIDENAKADTLKKAMLYSIHAGGKRIRPLLLLATAKSFGTTITWEHLAVAGALEMVHTYSLIHDDLPAMDNDDLRRGKPTNHKVFGEGMAVLAGDGLLTSAFELTAKAFHGEFVAPLAHAAGASGMVAGQVLDIEGEEKSLTLDELKEVHEKKTGALLRFAVSTGVAMAVEKETPKISENMLVYAKSFGLAFQIRDDILDITKSTEELGKTAGKDIVMNKSTYPALLGLDGAKQALSEELEKAKRALKNVESLDSNFDGQLLEEFIEMLEIKAGE